MATMSYFIRECKKRGWWREPECNPSRDWHEKWACELVENSDNPMPHAYICGYGPNRAAAIASAASQLGMFLFRTGLREKR